MSSRLTDIDELCAVTQEVIRLDLAVDTAVECRNKAVDHLIEMLGGGDRIGAIYNAHRRLGELMTGKADE